MSFPMRMVRLCKGRVLSDRRLGRREPRSVPMGAATRVLEPGERYRRSAGRESPCIQPTCGGWTGRHAA